MSLDLEAEYNNRARVAEHPAIFARWTRDAAAWRAAHAPRLLRYGPHPRHEIDLFECANAPARMVFIHGGYWQALDRSVFSHMARGAHLLGFDAAIMNYPLCPDVELATIVDSALDAIAALARDSATPMVLVGHSAGGHLAACALTQASRLKSHPPLRAYAISGVFDLAPLIGTSLNAALQLESESARALSPILWCPPAGAFIDAVVGDGESSEFLRQSRELAAAWRAAGAETRFEIIDNANHFTIIDALTDPASAMMQRIGMLMRDAAK